jgi:hypothetical protein
MTDNGRIALVGVGAIATGAVLYWYGQKGGSSVVASSLSKVADTFTRGSKLTTSTLDSTGLIVEDPSVLVAEAIRNYGRDFSLDEWSALEIYALARMSRSEAGSADGALSRKVRMKVAINDYNQTSWSTDVADVITYDKDPNGRHRFGTQHAGRRYSTAKDLYSGDIDLALIAVREWTEGQDESGGASHFVDVSGLGGVQPGTPSYDQLLAKWAPLKPFAVAGLPDDFVVFRKA